MRRKILSLVPKKDGINLIRQSVVSFDGRQKKCKWVFEITILLFLFVSPFIAASQVMPLEGSKLSYRLVGFSFPGGTETGNYNIEIATGTHKDITTFKKKVFVSVSSQNNKVMAEMPSFGKDYTWQIVYPGAGKERSQLFHFTVLSCDRVDPAKLRLRMLKSSNQYPNYYVSVDAGSVFYDMKGAPVAFIPLFPGFEGYSTGMSTTKQATVIFNFTGGAYEVNLNGDILWKAPSKNYVHGDTATIDPHKILPGVNGLISTSLGEESYHHDFARLSNGHYMVMGMEYIASKQVVEKDTSYIILSKEKFVPPGYSLGHYGTIIEFDKEGKVVWSWKDSEHLIGTDFDFFTCADTNARFDPHSNSFYFDENNNNIYLSYRNLSRIIKINYPSGKISEIYGEIFKGHSKSVGYGWFCNPHCVRQSNNGYLYFYNNNSCKNTDSIPTIVKFQEPRFKGDSLKKIWEFTCEIESDAPKRFGSGGSVFEMADSSMFVCMGARYSKMFIVNPDKQIKWSALPERYSQMDKKWSICKQYRANIISRNDLESLIWNAEMSIQKTGNEAQIK